MTDAYRYALRQLCLSLGLTEPATLEEVTSLQVGDYACHLTEHPVDHLLMFISLASVVDALVPVQNLFSQELCKPLLGTDPATGALVLWNRQCLTQMDRTMVYHQLETLIQAAEHLSGVAGKPGNASTTPDGLRPV